MPVPQATSSTRTPDPSLLWRAAQRREHRIGVALAHGLVVVARTDPVVVHALTGHGESLPWSGSTAPSGRR
jgi:hypothetical protein